MSQQQRHSPQPFHFNVSARPKSNKSSRSLFCAPYQIGKGVAQQILMGKRQKDAHGKVGPSQKCPEAFVFEGPMEVAVEIEITETEAEETAATEGIGTANSNLQNFETLSPATFRPKPGTSSVCSIQQLLRFDPDQCFDIEEFRVRMASAQQKIEDLCSLNLNNVKLKHENGQLREKLDKYEQRIALLECSVLERNERLKELLKENVFMRAQFKKVQNEFGTEAVDEVINGKSEGKAKENGKKRGERA